MCIVKIAFFNVNLRKKCMMQHEVNKRIIGGEMVDSRVCSVTEVSRRREVVEVSGVATLYHPSHEFG